MSNALLIILREGLQFLAMLASVLIANNWGANLPAAVVASSFHLPADCILNLAGGGNSTQHSQHVESMGCHPRSEEVRIAVDDISLGKAQHSAWLAV